MIAREKAGIIKDGSLVISAPQVPEAMTMIEDVCAKKHSELIVVGENEYRWLPGRATLRGQHFELYGESFWIPLLGRHQVANAVTAWAALDGMEQRAGLSVPATARREGLRAARWPGRMEILGCDPYVIVDSAHNGDSAHKLQVALRDFFPGRRVVFVFGASGDHPFADALSELVPLAYRVYVTRSRHPRAASTETLAQMVSRLGRHAEITDSVAEAIETALASAHINDLICITGSIFTVADAREFWFERNGVSLPPIDPDT
jgi:dihydrofolate synthase/folylpolyglutamate synthase